ncbi:Nicotianamine synthase protein-domain-containing protein [Dendryphion nanum]|uniref:Nicotianamine synthase protein-domain-containing protein n=1 Tax=Dendryphion nanum TaxID=256645 RepID=A0A9P9D0P2_9PLEO|nr:Nicotianamine synthase protein-domain-containing protein [Dendryphion nanum]
MSSAAHQIVGEIQSIYNSLSKLPSLAPGPQVNALLTRLVNLCVQSYSEELAANLLSQDGVESLCSALRPLCATAEGELEQYWARQIISTSKSQPLGMPSVSSSPIPHQHHHLMPLTAVPAQARNLLACFPYYDNYVDLAKLECHTLEIYLDTCSPDCRPSPCKLAFVGSGPMPLTSFCVLDRYTDATVHNIDRDSQALKVSEQLALHCGYGGRMTFSQEDVSLVDNGSSTTDWRSFQVVFLAALVGMDTPAKIEILAGLTKKLAPGTLVVARSARGMRGVLYPVLELSEDFQRIGLDILTVVHPWTRVVNSVVVMRVK